MSRFLSRRFQQAQSTQLAEAVDNSGKYWNIINLSLGDPDFITDEKIIDAAFTDAKNGHTRYAPPQGDPELIEGIIEYYNKKYGAKIDKSEVMTVVGACHGMFLALESILDSGDEAILHEPYFTPYYEQIRLAGGTPVIVETFEEDGFELDPKRLESVITNRTKAIIINTPCNPTGACFSSETLVKIAEIAVKHDLVVISDEVYGSFSFNEPFKPLMKFEGMAERTITLGSFSKDYAMTGWRIGYVIAPSYIINCIKDINEGICFSAPSISQRAAVHALRLQSSIQPKMIEEYRQRLLYSYERINSIPFLSVLPPQGSIYLFVNIKKTGLSSTEFSKKLLEEAHIVVVPGTAFGKSGEGYIRIACTVGMDKLKEAFDRIERMKI